MTTHALAHRPSRTGGIHTRADVLTSAGTHIPAADVHARQIAREAERWLALATERTRMKPGTLTAKAFGACAFSVHKRASSLAVPSKLTGTSRHQPKLRALSSNPEARWAALDLDAVEDGLQASHDGAPLGLVRSKHCPWVRPLVPFGLTVYLSRVTGRWRRPWLPARVQRRLRPRRGGPSQTGGRRPRRGWRLGGAVRRRPEPAPTRRDGRGPARAHRGPRPAGVRGVDGGPGRHRSLAYARRGGPRLSSPRPPGIHRRASNGATAGPARPTSHSAFCSRSPTSGRRTRSTTASSTRSWLRSPRRAASSAPPTSGGGSSGLAETATGARCRWTLPGRRGAAPAPGRTPR